MRRIRTENPEFGEQLRRLGHAAEPIKLLAVEPGETVGSMSVFVFPAPPGETVAAFASRVIAELRTIPGFSDLRRRRVRAAGGQAAELRYVVPYRDGDRLVELQTLQVLLIRRGREYGVTYSGDPETFSKLEPVFRKSIAALRVGQATNSTRTGSR